MMINPHAVRANGIRERLSVTHTSFSVSGIGTHYSKWG